MTSDSTATCTASDRVMVFVDYQNVYMAARERFGTPALRADHTFGQVNPLKLGELITRRRPVDRNSTLTGVQVFRGMPDASKDPKGNGACRAQVDTWKRLGGVGVTTRPLRYPRDYPRTKPEEKGIDVELALTYVMAAIEDRFDVGVLFSLDTDLRPALEIVAARRGHGQRAEVAAWAASNQPVRQLSISAQRLWCHRLSEADLGAVEDRTDYVRT